MPRVSAGLLMYRFHDGKLQMLLAHPGGPYFKNKDDGAWSIPKGEIEPGEDLLEAAKREFKEETGVTPTGPFIALTPVTSAIRRNPPPVLFPTGMAFESVESCSSCC
jgi:predicted NUDIX family NTP pyrophosphohydrolase